MSGDRSTVTSAVRVLRENSVEFTEHPYRYEEHAVVKTLVMEDDQGEPLVVLMHGDREVSTKALARRLGCKSVQICRPEVASRHSGYLVGGTSPFGTRKAMPVYVERTILELPRIWVNGGSRGFLVALDPRELVRVLGAVPVEVAIAA